MKQLLSLLFSALLLQCFAQDYTCYPPPFLKSKSAWADSLMNEMSTSEKVGQLFMVAAYSNRDEAHAKQIDWLIENYHIGGLIFMQGGPVRQAHLTNRYQAKSVIPLLLAMDAEWGLAMRLDSTIRFPRQLSLGAANDENLSYAYGAEMARQLKELGVHVSFAPVVDVNNNPNNPVIGSRSFGESVNRVSLMGTAVMRGLQDNGVLANAKHFPGHGDTDQDSHKTLPTIGHDRDRLDTLELAPFKHLIKEGLGSMMVAHLNIPSMDSMTSTLSPKIINDILRKELAFDGLVFTDALNMKGVSAHYGPGEVDLMALKAGNDILLFPGDVPKAHQMILKAIQDGEYEEAKLDEHVRKILMTKAWSTQFVPDSIDVNGLTERLNNHKAIGMHQRMVEGSMTIVQNKGLLPLSPNQKTAVLSIGSKSMSQVFEDASELFGEADYYFLPKGASFPSINNVTANLNGYDVVVINLMGTSNSPSKKFGLAESYISMINEIKQNAKVLVNWYGNPYALKFMLGSETWDGLMVAYHDDHFTIETSAAMIWGGASALGTLPVGVGSSYPLGLGYPLIASHEFRRTVPEFLGIDSDDLTSIDSIVKAGIEAQAFPGCRVMAIKDGHIILDKSYGHLTYEEKQEVNQNTVYDLASITKIIASTASLMYFVDRGKISIEDELHQHLDLPDTSEHYHLKIKDMLSHHAQLKSWIPFYLETVDKGKLNPEIYQTYKSELFNQHVAEGIFMNKNYVDTIYQRIADSGLREKEGYKYSDLGYYYLKQIIEKYAEAPLQVFVDSIFYLPMELSSMGYHPLEKMGDENIAPTEYDMSFRHQLIRGYVHDPGAAMTNGIGGHAGVFSNAFDLAAMMQMFMNGGEYKGKRYLSKETVDLFNTAHFKNDDNRRGVGFDKPDPQDGVGPTCDQASPRSFGHSGFTGTLAWADPENGLVYVFLSNRVYPNADNRKLLEMNVRTDIQAILYEALEKAEKRQNALSVFPKWTPQP